MLRILFSFICCSAVLITHCVVTFGQNQSYDTQILSKIDLSNDSVMLRILEDVTFDPNVEIPSGCYTVDMNSYKDAIFVRICLIENAVFDPRSIPFGYTVLNDRMIVFNHTFDYQFKLSGKTDTVTVKTSILDRRSDIKDIKYYCILDGQYGSFSTEEGWKWSDGNPDE